MTPTGTKGLDLYTWVDGAWRFVNSGRPTGKVNQATIIANMEPVEREYMLYLPLYDGVISLSIGIDAEASISVPRTAIPVRTKPIVFYGTSILQGGCANRPGMAHTNIISRRLNREIVNLGFSGNALLDYEIAEVMSSVDAGVYVLDFVPNASSDQIYEKMETFYRILRDKHPRTPIIFIEDPVFTHALFDKKIAIEINKKNKAVNRKEYIHNFFRKDAWRRWRSNSRRYSFHRLRNDEICRPCLSGYKESIKKIIYYAVH